MDGCTSLPYCEVDTCDVAWYACETLDPFWLAIQNCIKSQPEVRVCVGLIGETPRPTRIPLRVGSASLVQATVLPTACATQHVTPRQSVLGASRMLNARAAIATRALRHARRSGIAHGACINKCNVRTICAGVVLVREISQTDLCPVNLRNPCSSSPLYRLPASVPASYCSE